ncbi:MAG: 50S ribosome-binding GTPase [Methanomassiliicoccales archaeon]|nr:50S ribosome-binding GTPase [Methanomassiliicoccales archaeon]
MVVSKKKIPTIMRADEILDKAFKRLMKIEKEGDDLMESRRRTTVARITASGDIISSTMQKYVKAFPSMEKRDEFVMELIDLLVGMDQLKKSLGALSWCGKRTDAMRQEYIRKTKGATRLNDIEQIRKEYYGRVSSVVKQVATDLIFVGHARDEMRRIPTIDTELPTAVVAGFPNVGKSQLVGQLSSAKPRVAPYPFTTQGIEIGHFTDRYQRYQIVDTPGLLDRELEERNDIERQAVLALKHLADVIVFILDPTETSGYSLEKQLALLESLKRNFSSIPILEVENKADMMKTGSGRVAISALTGEGVEEVRARLIELLKPSVAAMTSEAQSGSVI